MCVQMKNQFKVKVIGKEAHLVDFALMLLEKKIPYRPIRRKEKERQSRYEKPEGASDKKRIKLSNFRSIHCYSYILIEALIGAIVVELTKETIKAIINWLKERRKKGLEDPQLELVIRGRKKIELNNENVKMLEKMLEQSSKNKKTKRKRTKINENTSQNEV